MNVDKNLPEPDFLLPTAEPVTVGWGKKETQFHGSLGKQSAIKKEVSGEKKIQKSMMVMVFRNMMALKKAVCFESYKFFTCC